MKQKNINSILESKLLQYSLVAGAVITGTQSANAYVVYTNPEDLLNVYTLAIDFNGDMTIDITIKADAGPSDSVNSQAIFVNWNSASGSGKMLGSQYNPGSSLWYAKALSGGYTIGPGKPFGNNPQGVLMYSGHGNWAGQNQKYLGVKFKIAGQDHYAWARISCSSFPYKLSLYDYAYESAANTAINGGTLPIEMNSFTATSNSNSVLLKWNTATEVNNFGFEIERNLQSSDDGWQKIGFVEGSGTSNSPKEYSFTDKNVTAWNYSYRLKQIDIDGSFTYSSIVEVNCNPQPSTFELSQNYPNPFNPATVIKYQVPYSQMVSLIVYDVLGNEVAKLVDEEKPAGTYDVKFDGSNLPSGVYLYKIEAGSFTASKKLMLVK